MSYRSNGGRLRVGRRAAAAGREGAGQAPEEGARGRAGDHRGPQDRQELLGHSRGATISSATATLPAACRAAAAMSATAPSSTCRSPRARSPRWSAAPSSTRSKITIAPVAAHALAGDLPGLRGLDRFAGRAAAGPPGQGRHGPGLPRGRRPVSGARARSSSRAAVRTGRTCASTSRRCSTASAPGSTSSRNCCSCCAASTRPNCSPAPGRT